MADGMVGGRRPGAELRAAAHSLIVYQDLAPPLRPRCHGAAGARLPDTDGARSQGGHRAPAQQRARAGDSWVVDPAATRRPTPHPRRAGHRPAWSGPWPSRPAWPGPGADQLGLSEVRAAPAVAAGHLAEALRMSEPAKMTARALPAGCRSHWR